MSILRLKLSIGIFSINKATWGKARSYTNDARKYRAKFFAELNKHKQSILAFRDNKYNQYHVHYIFTMPKLMTQKGVISHNSGDLTNIEKLPQDFIFNKKYNGSSWLKKMNYVERKLYNFDNIINLNSDDCFITQLMSNKVQGKETSLEIIITGM